VSPKIQEKISFFSDNYYEKFGYFSGKNNVIFGHFVNLSGNIIKIRIF